MKIKNKKQYEVALEWVHEFATDLKQMEEMDAPPTHVHPVMFKACKDAIRFKLHELQQQVLEYESKKKKP